MKHMLLLEDVNLSDLNIDLNKSVVRLELCDMKDGDIVSKITCDNILEFHYCGDGGNNIIPQYIGKIEVLLLEDDRVHVNIEGFISIKLVSLQCRIHN